MEPQIFVHGVIKLINFPLPQAEPKSSFIEMISLIMGSEIRVSSSIIKKILCQFYYESDRGKRDFENLFSKFNPPPEFYNKLTLTRGNSVPKQDLINIISNDIDKLIKDSFFVEKTPGLVIINEFFSDQFYNKNSPIKNASIITFLDFVEELDLFLSTKYPKFFDDFIENLYRVVPGFDLKYGRIFN